MPGRNAKPGAEPPMAEQFISEEIHPVAGTAEAAGMARGEPGLPGRFAWRGRQYQVRAVLARWKTSAHERGLPSAEKYLRRHWFDVTVDTGERMRLYCQRQAPRGGGARSRWYLYTVRPADGLPGRT